MLNVLAQIVCLETLSVDLALSFILTSSKFYAFLPIILIMLLFAFQLTSELSKIEGNGSPTLREHLCVLDALPLATVMLPP